MALGLLCFGLLDLVQNVVSIIAVFRSSLSAGGNIQINFPFGFLVVWFGAWLVWRDKRVIWPILAYLAAAGLGSLLGFAFVAGLGVPGKLVRAFTLTHPGWTGFYAAYLGLTAIFLAWMFVEARRTSWPAGSKLPPVRWLQPGAFAGYAAVISGAGCAGLLLLLGGSWTEPALNRARQRLGDGYDYQVINYHFNSVNGHTTYQAVVLAYTDTQLDSIQLNWED